MFVCKLDAEKGIGREGEKERESGVGLSVRHFGNLCSCGPVWRWWLTWPGLRAAASGWFPRIITLIGSIRAAVHWFMSTFLLLLTWISPCFLPLLRSNRRLQVFFYSALRQSGLAICNFGVPHCAFAWRSGLIHCWDSSFFNVTASLCGKEQIPIQRDGAGLSELTAEWTRWFGNCLLVSYALFLFFGPSSLWKVGLLLLSDYFYMFNLASFHMRKLWSLADADLWSHVAPECTLGANWVLLQLRVNSAHPL